MLSQQNRSSWKHRYAQEKRNRSKVTDNDKSRDMRSVLALQPFFELWLSLFSDWLYHNKPIAHVPETCRNASLTFATNKACEPVDAGTGLLNSFSPCRRFYPLCFDSFNNLKQRSLTGKTAYNAIITAFAKGLKGSKSNIDAYRRDLIYVLLFLNLAQNIKSTSSHAVWLKCQLNTERDFYHVKGSVSYPLTGVTGNLIKGLF